MTEVDQKKHPCTDCRFCQWCSDDRCSLCRNDSVCCRRKLSIREQIAAYNVLNEADVITEKTIKD